MRQNDSDTQERTSIESAIIWDAGLALKRRKNTNINSPLCRQMSTDVSSRGKIKYFA